MLVVCLAVLVTRAGSRPAAPDTSHEPVVRVTTPATVQEDEPGWDCSFEIATVVIHAAQLLGYAREG